MQNKQKIQKVQVYFDDSEKTPEYDYVTYDKIPPEAFDWSRFRLRRYPGFNLYIMFDQFPYHSVQPRYWMVRFVRCLIFTQEAYEKIDSIALKMTRAVERQGLASLGEDRHLAYGLLFGCNEWRNRTAQERQQIEADYRSNPPENYDKEDEFFTKALRLTRLLE